MRFPPEFIDRLRQHLPISEVIGKYVPIKRHGREFQALCPFHKEKSPSFTINDEKGFFHCFGCGAHGDAIGFIKDFEGLSYVEAVERLAVEAGLPIPKMTVQAQAYERQRHTLEEVVSLAAVWFEQQLQLPAGQAARDYLNERGLTDATQKQFGIGYAPPGRDSLKNEFIKRGIEESLLIEAGLLGSSTNDAGNVTGPSYDRFRDRLMFPIRNRQGKPVAFGGRLLPSSGASNLAKYLNSPETPLFKKGEVLFAYDLAKRQAYDKGNIVVAEGYMDVIALHQAGFTTAVAPLGTAITGSQLKLLWQAAPEPTLCLDGDAAGLRAMLRAAELALPLLKPGFTLKFAILPAGEDPDSFIRKAGKTSMLQALAKAKVLSEILWEHARLHYGTKTAENKASLEHYLMQTAERIADTVVKQHIKDYFRNQLYTLKFPPKSAKFVKKGALNALAPTNVPVNAAALPQTGDDMEHIKRMEDQLVSVVLLHPDILHQSVIEEYFGHMDFMQPVLDKLRASALEISANSQSTDSASLCKALAERGHAEKVQTLLHSPNAPLSPTYRAELMENPRVATQAFERAYSAYSMKKLEHELHIAAHALEQEMSEKSYDRFLGLQKQMDELRRARYSVMPDEQVS